MSNKKLLDEVGAKKIYEGESEDRLILTFTDNMVDADGNLKGKVRGKLLRTMIFPARFLNILRVIM